MLVALLSCCRVHAIVMAVTLQTFAQALDGFVNGANLSSARVEAFILEADPLINRIRLSANNISSPGVAGELASLRANIEELSESTLLCCY